MKTGFDYWSSVDLSKGLRMYWIGYVMGQGAFLLLSLIFKTAIPLIYLVGCLVPYLLLRLFEIIRRPYNQLIQNIQDVDNKLYNLIMDEYKKNNRLAASVYYKIPNAYLMTMLLKQQNNVMNTELKIFIDNYSKFTRCKDITISLWFILSVLSFFAGYLFGK